MMQSLIITVHNNLFNIHCDILHILANMFAGWPHYNIFKYLQKLKSKCSHTRMDVLYPEDVAKLLHIILNNCTQDSADRSYTVYRLTEENITWVLNDNISYTRRMSQYKWQLL